MGRLYVNQLKEQQGIDEVYRASDKQLRPNRNGNLYLQVSLSDRSGSIGTRMWNASENLYRDSPRRSTSWSRSIRCGPTTRPEGRGSRCGWGAIACPRPDIPRRCPVAP